MNNHPTFGALSNADARVAGGRRVRLKERRRRRHRRRLFETLEHRHLLAAFSEAGNFLNIDLAANEQVAIVSNGSDYSLTLTGGTWSGSDSANVTGDGGANLTVTSAGQAVFDMINVDDSGAGTAVTFDDSGANAYSDSFLVTLDDAAAGAITFAGFSSFTGTAAIDASTTRNILFSDGSILTTVDGGITLSGNGAGLTTGSFVGLQASNATIESTGVGNISLTGFGGDDAGSAGLYGVHLDNGAAVRSTASGPTAGSITIDGTGGDGTVTGTGVQLNESQVTTVDGDIQLSGTGGHGSGSSNQGVALFSGGLVESTGTGSSAATITIDGWGGGGTDSNVGVTISLDVGVRSVDGDIRITGTGGNGSGIANHGVSVAGSTVESTGTGPGAAKIDVIGTGGSGTHSSIGVYLLGPFAVGRIASADGDIHVAGTGGDSSGPQNMGVALNHDTKIESTGTGAEAANISVHGTGSAGTTQNYGVYIRNDNEQSKISTVDGDIDVTGIGGDGSGSENVGVYLIEGAIVESTGTDAGAGTISINGTGGDGTDSNVGVHVSHPGSGFRSGYGDIGIAGTGGSGSGSNNDGVRLADSALIESTGLGMGAATIEIDGFGGSGFGSNVGFHQTGSSTAIRSIDGDIDITGTGGSGTSINNTGVLIAGGTVESAGTYAERWLDYTDATATALQLSSVPANDAQEKDIASGDLDHDGWVDVVVVRKFPFSAPGARGDLLLMNQQGVLTDQTSTLAPEFISQPTDARDVVIRDFDGDGWDDVVIATTFEDPPRFYRNRGNDVSGNWLGLVDESTRIPTLNISTVQFCALWAGDVNGDGHLDLYFSNYIREGIAPDVLLINDGNGNFTDESDARLGNLRNSAFGTSVEIVDMDNDGDNDIVKLSASRPVEPWNANGVFILYNNGDGTFTNYQQLPGQAPYMFSTGDLTHDGLLDVYMVDDFLDYVHLGTNVVTVDEQVDFEKRFVNSNETLGFGGNLRMVDLDNDGDLDVGLADVDTDSPPCDSSRHTMLFRNDEIASGSLEDPWPAPNNPWNESVFDLEFIDINNDGRLDMLQGRCNDYAVFLNEGINLPSDSANITITGTGGGENGTGVQIDDSTVTTSDGDITVTGFGAAGSSSYNFGVVMTNGGVVESTGLGADAGTVTIAGTGGAGTTFNHGVIVFDVNSEVRSVDGNIQITGVAGNGTSVENVGVRIANGGAVRSTGTGADAAAIMINGTGGDGTEENRGIFITGAGALVETVDGDINLTGTGGSATLTENYGVHLADSGVVQSVGTGPEAGKITVNGFGGEGTHSNYGIFVEGVGSRFSSIDGDVNLTGTGHENSTTFSRGVLISEGAKVESTGTAANAAAITINGTAGGVARTNGVAIVGHSDPTTVTSVNGDISITGDGGPGTFTAGVLFDGDYASVQSTGNGADAAQIAIIGQGGEGGIGIGVDSDGASILSVDGNVTVHGTGSPIGRANIGVAVRYGSLIESTGTGPDAASIMVTGAGGGGDSFNVGVYLYAQSTIRAGYGDILVTGTSNGTTTTNLGVGLNFGGVIQSTGTGAGAANITVNGTAGDGSIDNHGVFIDDSDSGVQTVDGDINITGIAGNASEFENHGVKFESGGLVSGSPTGTGTISIHGSSVPGNAISAATIEAGNSPVVLTADGDITIILINGQSTVDVTSTGGTISDIFPATDIGGTTTTLTGTVTPRGSNQTGELGVLGDAVLGSGSVLDLEFAGTNTGSQYDQLTATGAVDIAAGVTLDTHAIGGFMPLIGQWFTIIERNGGTGEFLGLPESTWIPNFLGSDLTAVITYAGGDGDDVELAVFSPPIVDNGDPGFFADGNWVHVSGNNKGHDNDFLYNIAGTGADTATWTFVVPYGQYRISATWRAYTNRATNAPFTIIDGNNALTTAIVNQQNAPADRFDEGVWFEDLGEFNITDILTVELSDLADGLVIADAIRIERLGDVILGPEIKVSVDGGDIADDTGVVDFGTVEQGTAVGKRFTVTNLGTTYLTLDTPITVPPGFTLVSSFGETRLLPFESTTFLVVIDTTSVGVFGGEVSFTNDDADENPFNFTLQGEVIEPTGIEIIDNGDPAFSTNGSWVNISGNGKGHQNDFHYAIHGDGSKTATWTFDVDPGQYQVAATWKSHTNRATNAPFTIRDAATPLDTIRVDQKAVPSGFIDEETGTTFDELGTFTVYGGQLVVVLDNQADGLVIADAIRIERVGDAPNGSEIAVRDEVGNIPDNGGVADFGDVIIGTTAVKTIMVTNAGNQPLTLVEPINLPAGFSLESSFGATTLGAQSSTTFQVRIDSTAIGQLTGEASFGNTDSDENPFNFTIEGTIVPLPAVQIIDDGEANFVTAGTWVRITGNNKGHQNDFLYAASGDGSTTATWAFDVDPGTYRVSVSYRAHTNRATDAPFTVLDGTTALQTVDINQQVTADDRVDAGTAFEDLGTFTISGSQLSVVLTNQANGLVIADAVRIERL